MKARYFSLKLNVGVDPKDNPAGYHKSEDIREELHILL
jgi:hypothetical protein